MERGVLVGGLLISASFLLAVTLNQAAKEASRRDLPPAPTPQLQAPMKNQSDGTACSALEPLPAKTRDSVRPSTNCKVAPAKPE